MYKEYMMDTVADGESSSIYSERELYRAIIAQAIEDVTVKWPVGDYTYGYRPPIDEIKKSLLFLTATSGPWKESRDDICYGAGLSSSYVRKKTIEAIESGTEYRISDYSSDYEE